jgi:hypothetical protein
MGGCFWEIYEIHNGCIQDQIWMIFFVFWTGINQVRCVTEAVEESGISEDHPLHSLVKSLSKRLINARSDSTVKKYYYSFMKWEKFNWGFSSTFSWLNYFFLQKHSL